MTEPTKTLPADWYWRPEIFRAEKSAVFGREWLYAAHMHELQKPGDYVTVDIAGASILLLVDRDGALRGFHNVCRHRAAPLLVEECGNRGTGALVCPYHGWSYTLDGGLLNAPLFEDLPACTKADLSLHQVQVATYRGLVFVNLDKHAKPFLDVMGPLVNAIAASGYPMESYRFHSKMVREGSFNWKTWVDGFQECYHCPTIHPVFKRDFALREYRVENRERFSIHSCARRDGSVTGRDDGLWLWVHPNLGLPCYGPCFYTLQVNPLTPTRTRLTYTFHFHDETKPNDADDFIAFVRQITEEDVRIVESVQRNLESGVFNEGVLNPTRENGVAYFHALVRDAVTRAL